MSVSDAFVGWAREAVSAWDGLSTAELIVLICSRTGEDPRRVLVEMRELLDRKEDPYERAAE